MRKYIQKQFGNTLSRKGIALIITLFVLIFLASLGLSYAFAVQLEMSLVRNYRDDLQAQYIARAGIYAALGELKEQQRRGYFAYPKSDIAEDMERLERYEEIFCDVQLGEGTYSVKFKDSFGQTGLGPMDESSLIDINALAKSNNKDVFSDLLEIATDDINTIDKIIDCVSDYIDGDDNARINGAEEMDYEDMDPPELIRNGPMRDPSEFLTVLNVMSDLFPDEVDDSIWYGEDVNQNGILDPNEDDGAETPPIDDADGRLDKGIREYITVYTGSATVNANTAPREILEIVMPDRVEQIMEDRQFGHVSGNSSTFRICSYGTAHDYTHVTEWIVRLGGPSGYPTVLRMRSN